MVLRMRWASACGPIAHANGACKIITAIQLLTHSPLCIQEMVGNDFVMFESLVENRGIFINTLQAIRVHLLWMQTYHSNKVFTIPNGFINHSGMAKIQYYNFILYFLAIMKQRVKQSK